MEKKPVDKEIEAMRPIETPPDTLKAMRELIQDGENDVARLPEHLFVSELLPVLTDRSGNVNLGVWLDIAGHGFRPIDVYDPATGVTLFRVPSLYSRRPTKPIGDSRHSLAQVAHQANQYGTQHPAIAQTFLTRTLAARPVDRGIDWVSIRQWNTILARYGHPPVIEIPTPASKPGPGASDGSEPTGPYSPGALAASADQDDF